jgi:hypothetical protein
MYHGARPGSDVGEDGKRTRNDRLVVLPIKGRWTDEFSGPDDVPPKTIEKLEHFFLSSVFFTHRSARCLGWKARSAPLASSRRRSGTVRRRPASRI